jgi:peroxiredoxin
VTNLDQLPVGLPVPSDDGAANHLTGAALPSVTLPATSGELVALDGLDGPTVLFVYPKTGRPGVPLPTDWDQIPGARGCTPQSCAFRDLHAEFAALGVRVYGLSSQSSSYQLEARARLHLPFELLSDQHLALHAALRFPVFSADGETLYKRLTLVCDGPLIRHVFYPVFPPDRNAQHTLAWIRAHARLSPGGAQSGHL